MTLRLLCLGALAIAAALYATPARAAEEFEKQRAYYETQIDRPPLAHRLRGMVRLAGTKDPRALAILAKRYAKPRVPKEHERYLLAAVIGKYFRHARDVDPLWKLLRKHKKPEHAWLWLNGLAAAARQSDASQVTAAIRNKKLKPHLRAAAWQALAGAQHPAALPLVLELLGQKLPRAGTPRIVLLESAAAVLLAQRSRLDSPVYQQATGAVIDLLKRDDVPARTKLVIARHLARIFNVETVTLEHQFWRRLLGFEGQPEQSGQTVAGRPRFFGLEATGTRVAYLLDMSDSMLDPLSQRERDEARAEHRIVVTGAKSSPQEDVDWSKIRSRFDLARLYLKRSIAALPSDVFFLVIAFGSRAEALRSTKGLVKASRGSIRAVLKELDDVKPGRKTQKRPYGTLRGTTNLHGALLRAFRAAPKKLLDEYEHVDPTLLSKGCDTIFVFSDGRPTKDDFDAQDRFDGGNVVADREKGGVVHRAAGSANYFGPYVRAGNLLTDVRRMNAFRKAEIHTIAMGEADSSLLQKIARLGLGGCRPLGILGRAGRLNAWWLMGPYPAPKPELWAQTEKPEEGVHLKGSLLVGGKRVRWERVFTNHRNAVVDLDKHYGKPDGVAAYAYAQIEVAAAGPARLELGSDDGVRVWLNDKLVHSVLKTRKLKVNGDHVDVELVRGTNRILLKVCDAKGPWRFCLRITDPQGKPFPFLMQPFVIK